jgi:hypothetical protein
MLAPAQGSTEDFRAATSKLLGAVALNLDFSCDSRKIMKHIMPVAKHLLKERQDETANKRVAFRIQKAGLDLPAE